VDLTVAGKDALPGLEGLGIRDSRKLLERNVRSVDITSVHSVRALVANKDLIGGVHGIDIEVVAAHELTLVLNAVGTNVGRAISRLNTTLKLGGTLKKRGDERRGKKPVARTAHRGAVDVLRSEVD